MCIRFSTIAQKAQLSQLSVLDSSRMIDPVSRPSAPELTETKVSRLRLLAESDNPKIRERIALDYHTPEDVMAKLAVDPDPGVRACVARNETASCEILRSLVTDSSETVRGFLAWNTFVPLDAMEKLSQDTSEIVLRVVRWKKSLE